MSLYIPTWLLWLVCGYIACRTIEALSKLIAYLAREKRDTSMQEKSEKEGNI